MVRKIFVSMALLVATASSAFAETPTNTNNFDIFTFDKIGVGLVLGEPSGFSAKLWQDSSHAIDFSFGYSVSNFVVINSDYLWHFPDLLHGTEYGNERIFPYIGVGGSLYFSTQSDRTDNKFFTNNGSSVGLGIRIPIGAEWLPHKTPFGVFAEVVPGIGIIPSTFGFFQLGIGGRLYL
jgi:hypothetical protein